MPLNSPALPRNLILAAVLVMVAQPAAAGIACTQAAFETALAQACNGGSKTITFDASCRGAVIPIAPGTRASREIACDGVVVDGQDLQITFQMTPSWWQSGAHCDANGDGTYGEACDTNGDGAPDLCPEFEGGDWFLMVRGNNCTVGNLTVRHFYDGIHFDDSTHGNTVHHVTFVKQADDSFTNEAGAWGNTFANNILRDHCDKGIQLDGRDAGGSTGYDVEVLDNEFTNVAQPIRGPHNGRYLVRGNLIRESAPSALFRCEGPRFDGSNAAVYWTGNTVDGCQRGLRISGAVSLIASGGNVFANNRVRGIYLYDGSNGSPRGMVEDSTFIRNGGTTSSENGYGGIAVAGAAQLDAGGGSLTLDGQVRPSHGGNVFDHNRSSADASLDVQLLGTGPLKAESNWWGDTTPSDQVEGSVDFSPWLSGPPVETSGPEPPSNLRRDDVRP